MGRRIAINPGIKPCAICYSAMKKVKQGWECPRHGFVAEEKR